MLISAELDRSHKANHKSRAKSCSASLRPAQKPWKPSWLTDEDEKNCLHSSDAKVQKSKDVINRAMSFQNHQEAAMLCQPGAAEALEAWIERSLSDVSAVVIRDESTVHQAQARAVVQSAAEHAAMQACRLQTSSFISELVYCQDCMECPDAALGGS